MIFGVTALITAAAQIDKRMGGQPRDQRLEEK
jgi:hypothetical protein